jgi:endonuclease/exonuclease/phosphatase family metal-dependent hydrolase
MDDVLAGNFSASRCQLWRPQAIRVINWNIDRGLRLPEITDFLESQKADLLTLQEVDLNARRTHFRNVAEELARKLQMNYVFGREFEELTQGSRILPAYHGQATLSRWRLKNARVIRFRYQSGFWRPRWFLPRVEPFQERLGGRMALATEVDVLGRVFNVYNLHLESRGDNNLRFFQLKQAVEDAGRYVPRVPTLLAGDLNFDISEGDAAVLVRRSGFRNVLGQSRFYTRPARSLFGTSRSIDWALVSGPVEATLGQVHGSVNASDHYPISFTLRLS